MARTRFEDGSLPELVPLARQVLARDSVRVARELIGCYLVHSSAAGVAAGRIVEAEAYDQTDPASHSFRGPTPRTLPMFGPAGHAYVYFSYGMHWCMNVVTGREGHGAAVLLRALEPVAGLELIRRRRGLSTSERDLRRLLAGPGCLTQGLGVGTEHNGGDLLGEGPLRLLRPARFPPRRIIATGRIGISRAQELPWRFLLDGSPFVSGRVAGKRRTQEAILNPRR